MAQNTPFNATRKRRQKDPSNSGFPTGMSTVLTVGANKLAITCDRPVSVAGLPQVAISGGAHTGTEYPTACTITNQTTFVLTYAHNVAAADTVIIPDQCAGVRAYNGAFMAGKTKVL